MHKISTFAIAVALGLAWTAFPAGAADDTLKNKAERTGDKIEDKAERAKDKIEDKSERAKDKIENKSERAKDKAEAKADRAKDKADAKGDTMGDKVDRAVDKTKAKTREMKDKVADKMHRGDKGDHMASGDTRSAQEALQAKGYNPGPIDGVYGPRTTAAVRDFQKAEGLKVTGRMDADTRAKLMASAGAGSTPSASTTTTTTPSASPSTTPARQACCGEAEEAAKSSARFTSWRRALAARAAASRYTSKPRITEDRKIFIAARLRSGRRPEPSLEYRSQACETTSWVKSG